MSLAFLAKKSWHTSNLKNVEKVWIAERKHASEEKKVLELQKQIQEERQMDELVLLQKTQGEKVKASTSRVDWMYDGPMAHTSTHTSEAFLLGATYTENKSMEGTKIQENEKKNMISSSVNDAFTRLHEDPMLAIRKRQQESQKEILKNPVKMQRIQQKVEMELKEKKEKKRKKKEKKKRKRKERSASSSRSCSPVERRQGRVTSRSPVKRQRRQRSRSPVARQVRSRNRSPVNRPRRQVSRSPATRRPRSSSRSPVDRQGRQVSRSPATRRPRSSNRSPVNRQGRQKSRSPATRRPRSGSRSPVTRQRRQESLSPTTRRPRSVSRSQVARRPRPISRSPVAQRPRHSRSPARRGTRQDTSRSRLQRHHQRPSRSASPVASSRNHHASSSKSRRRKRQSEQKSQSPKHHERSPSSKVPLSRPGFGLSSTAQARKCDISDPRSGLGPDTRFVERVRQSRQVELEEKQRVVLDNKVKSATVLSQEDKDDLLKEMMKDASQREANLRRSSTTQRRRRDNNQPSSPDNTDTGNNKAPGFLNALRTTVYMENDSSGLQDRLSRNRHYVQKQASSHNFMTR